MTEERLNYLLTQLLSGQIDPTETEELEAYKVQNPLSLELIERLTNRERMESDLAEFGRHQADSRERVEKTIEQLRSDGNTGGRIFPIRALLAAAAVLLCVVGAVFLVRRDKNPNNSIAETKLTSKRPAPGTDKAVLTLADGTTLELGQASQDQALAAAGVGATTDKGRLTYSGRQIAASNAGKHILSTPRSGQFKLVLSDGTKVWLNNSSKIEYPALFDSSERNVSVEGEAYFEVAKDTKKPFRVSVSGTRIDVLGTSFNIKAYADESHLITTLVEGKVRVSEAAKAQVLLPGQQLHIRSGDWVWSKDPDINEAISWKNGFFNFDNADLQEVMRQLSRWYDVTVEYKSNKLNEKYHGGIQRSLPLEEILKSLQMQSDLHFELKGSTIIVSK